MSRALNCEHSAVSPGGRRAQAGGARARNRSAARWHVTRFTGALLAGGVIGAAAFALLFAVLGTLVFSPVAGLGLPFLAVMIWLVRPLGWLERHRVRLVTGTAVAEAYRPLRGSLPARVRTLLTDTATWRDLARPGLAGRAARGRRAGADVPAGPGDRPDLRGHAADLGAAAVRCRVCLHLAGVEHGTRGCHGAAGRGPRPGQLAGLPKDGDGLGPAGLAGDEPGHGGGGDRPQPGCGPPARRRGASVGEQLYARELLSDGAGGVGYLLKDRVGDGRQFVEAVRRVADGGTAMDPEVISGVLARRSRRTPLAALTPREREVLALMAEGRTNAAIGRRLVVASKAVSKHIARIFAKLGLPPSGDDHRRVLAVLAYLNSNA
jgi:DNA-binding CsgD family transcriptional regulator